MAAREHYAMAAVFGLLSVPWTFGFEQVAGLPLWPSFIGSASLFAAGGLARSLPNNLVGAFYGALTLWIAAWLGGSTLALSLLVGAFMLLASLHALVGALSFTPAAFLGYAALFSVDGAGVGLGATEVAGALVATLASLAIGAALGWLAGEASATFTRRSAMS